MPYASVVGNSINMADVYTTQPGGHSGIGLTGVGTDIDPNDPDEPHLTAARPTDHALVLNNTVQQCRWHGLQSDVYWDTYDSYCTILNNSFILNGINGILANHTDHWTISGNVCNNNANYGIQVINSNNLTLTYNEFSDRGNGDDQQDAGIQIIADPSFPFAAHFSSEHITIAHNTVDANQYNAIEMRTQHTLSAVTLINYVDILYNDIENNGAYWLAISSWNPGTNPLQINNINPNQTTNTLSGNGNGTAIDNNA